ncbi:MAG TPA: Nif3-like dinuclear metal center hexameric protein [Firmicutes bacterium]|nr:Nif3-like dinuclear metal center hexameric protein [Bacillota bacterium]
MYTVKEIVSAIEELAPKELAESWDNPGLMVGDFDAHVRRVLICLDVTSKNVEQAVSEGAELIISHHPLLFKPAKSIIEQTVQGNIIRTLIKNDISVYSAHTNLDIAAGGTNDALAERLGLINIREFTDDECVDEYGAPLMKIGRVGQLPEKMNMLDFTAFVEQAISCESIRFVGDESDIIKTVALCTGAGGDGIYSAYNSGADVYVTSDIRHHEAQLAFELGLNLVDAGHFETENTICEFMAEYLKERFGELIISASLAKPYFRSL